MNSFFQLVSLHKRNTIIALSFHKVLTIYPVNQSMRYRRNTINWRWLWDSFGLDFEIWNDQSATNDFACFLDSNFRSWPFWRRRHRLLAFSNEPFNWIISQVYFHYRKGTPSLTPSCTLKVSSNGNWVCCKGCKIQKHKLTTLTERKQKGMSFNQSKFAVRAKVE